MNLRDYLALKQAHESGDAAAFTGLVLEHAADVVEAVRNEIGAATSDDPPLMQRADPVLVRLGHGWAHRGGSVLDAKLSQADVFAPAEIGGWLAGKGMLSLQVVRPPEGLVLIDDELLTLRNTTDRARRESWRLQRLRVNLDGLVK